MDERKLLLIASFNYIRFCRRRAKIIQTDIEMCHFLSAFNAGAGRLYVGSLLCRLAGACIALLMGASCVGPVRDNVGTDFRAARIAHYSQIAAQWGTPYADVDTKEKRNQFIDEFVAIKNLQFQNYVTAIRRGTSYGQLTADATRLVLGGLGALTGGVAVKSALSAASAGVTGFTSSVQKDVLFDQSIPIFIAKMEELRANKLADIINKKKLSFAEYTPSEAFNDIQDYGTAGTFDAALQAINVQVGRATAQAKTDLAIAKGDTISAAANAALNRPVRQPTAVEHGEFQTEKKKNAKPPPPLPKLRTAAQFGRDLTAVDAQMPPEKEKKEAIYKEIFDDISIDPFHLPEPLSGLTGGPNAQTLSAVYHNFPDKQQRLNDLLDLLIKNSKVSPVLGPLPKE